MEHTKVGDDTQHSFIYRVSLLFYTLFIITSGISISISQASLLIALLVWLFGYFRGCDDIEYYKTGIEKYIVSFIVISIALAFLSPSVIGNLLYLRDFWLVSAFILVTSLVRTMDDILKIVRLIVFVAIFQAIAGFIGYITDINFVEAIKHGIEHPKAHLSMRLIVGFLGHHLTYSGYIMMLSVPIIYLSFLKKEGSINDRNIHISKVLIIVSAVLSIVAILLSWSRSVIIALPFATIPLFFKRRAIFFVTLITAVLVIILIFSGLRPSQNIKKNLYNASSTIRIQIWKNAFRVWKKHPFFGSGGANYRGEFKGIVKKYPKENRLFRYYFTDRVTHAHNDYLNQLARKGIVGFVAFIYMLCGIFKYMIVNIDNIRERFLKYLYLGIFGSFATFLVASLFQCYYTDEEVLVMLWFNTGLLVSIVKIEKGRTF